MTNQQIANVWNEMGKGFFTFYISGPMEHSRVQTPIAGGAAEQLDDRPNARPRGARRVERRRLEPGGISQLQTPAKCLGAA